MPATKCNLNKTLIDKTKEILLTEIMLNLQKEIFNLTQIKQILSSKKKIYIYDLLHTF